MELFDLPEVTQILRNGLGMPEVRAKNWTLGRPLNLGGSVRTGSRTLYTENDILRLGLAYELRKAGMAVKPIEKIILELKKSLNEITFLTVSRTAEDAPFDILEGKRDSKTTVSLTVKVGSFAKGLQKEIAAQLRRRGQDA